MPVWILATFPLLNTDPLWFNSSVGLWLNLLILFVWNQIFFHSYLINLLCSHRIYASVLIILSIRQLLQYNSKAVFVPGSIVVDRTILSIFFIKGSFLVLKNRYYIVDFQYYCSAMKYKISHNYGIYCESNDIYCFHNDNVLIQAQTWSYSIE